MTVMTENSAMSDAQSTDNIAVTCRGVTKVYHAGGTDVVALRGIERGRQFVDGRHQSLGDEPAAVAAKSPARVRPFDYRLLPPLWGRVGVGGRRHDSLTPRTAATKARSLAGSLRPGSASTPLQTSTPQG